MKVIVVLREMISSRGSLCMYVPASRVVALVRSLMCIDAPLGIIYHQLQPQIWLFHVLGVGHGRVV